MMNTGTVATIGVHGRLLKLPYRTGGRADGQPIQDSAIRYRWCVVTRQCFVAFSLQRPAAA
jgi:hypothetical protein